MIIALLIVLSIVSVYAFTITLLWRSSAASVDTLMQRWARCNGQFVACDAELNRLKVEHAKLLMAAKR